jgi:hypothetical protein
MKDLIISKEQIERNPDRFPESFRFQLNAEERNELVANCDRFEILKSITLVLLSRIWEENGLHSRGWKQRKTMGAGIPRQ